MVMPVLGWGSTSKGVIISPSGSDWTLGPQLPFLEDRTRALCCLPCWCWAGAAPLGRQIQPNWARFGFRPSAARSRRPNSSHEGQGPLSIPLGATRVSLIGSDSAPGLQLPLLELPVRALQQERALGGRLSCPRRASLEHSGVLDWPDVSLPMGRPPCRRGHGSIRAIYRNSESGEGRFVPPKVGVLSVRFLCKEGAQRWHQELRFRERRLVRPKGGAFVARCLCKAGPKVGCL